MIYTRRGLGMRDIAYLGRWKSQLHRRGSARSPVRAAVCNGTLQSENGRVGRNKRPEPVPATPHHVASKAAEVISEDPGEETHRQ